MRSTRARPRDCSTSMRFEAARNWPWLLGLAGFAFDVAASWPGQVSFDSAYAWWQARGGESSTLVPPAFVLAWRASLAFADGPGGMFALQLALFWSGLALVAQALGASALRGVAWFVLVGFAPVVLVLRAHVWTDVALFAALVFASGALAQVAAGGRRHWLLPAALALGWATLLRHNALPATVPLVAWASVLALRGERARWRVFALASTLLLVFGAAGRLLDAQATRRVPVWPSLAQFDLAAISVATDRLYLPAFMHGPALDVADLAQAFRPWSNTPMLQGTRGGLRDPFDPPFDASQLATLRAAWFEAIRAEPRAWLAHRWRLARALFGQRAPEWPRELAFVDAVVPFGDNPPVHANDGHLHRLVAAFAQRHYAGAGLAAWPCLVPGLLALPFAWRRRARVDGRLCLVLLASAWLYALPLVVLAPAAELRYLGWPCVASLMAAASVLIGSSARAARLPRAPCEDCP